MIDTSRTRMRCGIIIILFWAQASQERPGEGLHVADSLAALELVGVSKGWASDRAALWLPRLSGAGSPGPEVLHVSCHLNTVPVLALSTICPLSWWLHLCPPS